MLITKFKHWGHSIDFEIVKEGVAHKVNIEKTEHGTRFTDINDFSEEWEDEDYEALEAFVEGCNGLLLQLD